MQLADGYRTSGVAEAFDRALDILGEKSKQALLWHLKHEYDIDATQIKPPDVSKIQYALANLLGNDGSEVLIKHLDMELKKLQQHSDA